MKRRMSEFMKATQSDCRSFLKADILSRPARDQQTGEAHQLSEAEPVWRARPPLLTTYSLSFMVKGLTQAPVYSAGLDVLQAVITQTSRPVSGVCFLPMGHNQHVSLLASVLDRLQSRKGNPSCIFLPRAFWVPAMGLEGCFSSIPVTASCFSWHIKPLDPSLVAQ